MVNKRETYRDLLKGEVIPGFIDAVKDKK